MKKRLLLFAICWMSCLYSTAQFYDRAWLVGFYGDIKLTYLTNTPDTARFLINTQQQIAFTSNGSNVSDTNGNILFMANCGQVGGPTGYPMDNSDGIIDSAFSSWYPEGVNVPNANIILPKGNNQFYLFIETISDSLWDSGTTPYANIIYYAIIDMNMDSGMGKVISKKNRIWNNGLIEDSRLTACRHANGRDWWLVGHGLFNDEFFTYLVTPDSIYPPVIQHMGSRDSFAFAGQSVFSSDGSRFASTQPTGAIVIADFDRCTGLFSLRDTFSLPYDSIIIPGQNQPVECDPWSGIGCSLSPSGRFLYISTQCYLMQYDMLADTISASGVLVARPEADSFPPLFNNSFLMPNGQIVMCSYRYGPSNFHLIQYPDQKAPNCGFVYYGLATNSASATSLPNMVNYRLGALPGSGCDTLGIPTPALPEGEGVKVYPNPSSSHVLIGLTQYHKNAQLYIYDALGNVLYENNAMYLDDDVNVSCFVSGIYLIKVSSADGDLYARFVKE